MKNYLEEIIANVNSTFDKDAGNKLADLKNVNINLWAGNIRKKVESFVDKYTVYYNKYLTYITKCNDDILPLVNCIMNNESEYETNEGNKVTDDEVNAAYKLYNETPADGTGLKDNYYNKYNSLYKQKQNYDETKADLESKRVTYCNDLINACRELKEKGVVQFG